MTKEKLAEVYDLLVTIGGADKDDKDNFIYNHLESKYPCTEWRFWGFLGFGGKYRSTSNTVTYYPEDKTLERIAIAKMLNEKLSEL